MSNFDDNLFEDFDAFEGLDDGKLPIVPPRKKAATEISGLLLV